jgi:predicted glycosyltransferase
MGLGESVARDVILSEQYRQNFFHSDFRIREITQGYSVFDYINRNTLYTRYFIQHNVPRFNNPTSTFDNDQYLLEVITCGSITAFENFVNAWLGDCSQCTGLEVEGCVEPICEPTYLFPQIGNPNFTPEFPQICD